MSEYQQQAEQFLKDTNTSFLATFADRKKYFPDDDSVRDVYDITLRRGDKVYKFQFGQSLNDSKHWELEPTDKRISFGIGFNNLFMTEDEAKRKKAEILRTKTTVKDKDIKINTITAKVPNSYDVLSCLEKYEYDSFEDFCHNCGYDTDSRKAEKIYLAVKEQCQGLSNMFTEEELERMREIQ